MNSFLKLGLFLFFITLTPDAGEVRTRESIPKRLSAKHQKQLFKNEICEKTLEVRGEKVHKIKGNNIPAGT